MKHLTEEQLKELDVVVGSVPRLLDPRDNAEYVLVRADVYQRLVQTHVVNPQDAYPLIDESFREGWEAPGMRDYDDYENRKLL